MESSSSLERAVCVDDVSRTTLQEDQFKDSYPVGSLGPSGGQLTIKQSFHKVTSTSSASVNKSQTSELRTHIGMKLMLSPVCCTSTAVLELSGYFPTLLLLQTEIKHV